MLTELLLDRFPMAYASATSVGRVVSQGNTQSKPSRVSDASESQGSGPAYKLELSEESKAKSANGKKLSEEEQKQVEDMKERDREVRAHEQAHLAAAGGYARGGIHLETEKGPDGRAYAVGGHVNLDTSKENSPEATLQKAMTLQKAATAPASPSSQDRAVAAQAAKMAQEARQEIREENQNPEKVSQAGSAKSAWSGYSASGQGQVAPAVSRFGWSA